MSSGVCNSWTLLLPPGIFITSPACVATKYIPLIIPVLSSLCSAGKEVNYPMLALLTLAFQTSQRLR